MKVLKQDNNSNILFKISEIIFERLTTIATSILGSSFTFISAFALVIIWWINNLFTTRNFHQIIGDIILGTAFLSLFIFRKYFKRMMFSSPVEANEILLLNELDTTSEQNLEEKTEGEIIELTLSKEYAELAKLLKELIK
jgi:hypothetical protein